MKISLKNITSCTLLAALCFPGFQLTMAHANTGVVVEKLMESEKSWDGTEYPAYPSGTAQLTMLKITVPPHTTLAWHEHPMPNAAYMLSGELTVEKKSNGKTRLLKAGDALPEMVDIIHRGFTKDKEAQLIVFYAGKKGLPLSIPEKK